MIPQHTIEALGGLHGQEEASRETIYEKASKRVDVYGKAHLDGVALKAFRLNLR